VARRKLLRCVAMNKETRPVMDATWQRVLKACTQKTTSFEYKAKRATINRHKTEAVPTHVGPDKFKKPRDLPYPNPQRYDVV